MKCSLLNTLIHLKPIQVFYQVRNRVVKRKYAACVYRGSVDYAWHVAPIPRPTCTDKEQFRFLNISSPISGWNDESHGMLWAYNLNYFDFINQKEATLEYGLHWMDKFIQEIGENRVGLDPYPIALRGVNWVKFFRRHPEGISKERLDSLYSQYKLLQRKLEYHLLGNHLLEDFFSLYIMSLFFDEPEFHAWVTEKLMAELEEEILEDGGHFEQSAMYHCILLDRLLDCINKGWDKEDDIVMDRLKGYASRMLGWLVAFCYRDNTYAFLNDVAHGVSPSSSELYDYAKRLGLSWQGGRLKESGYRKMEGAGKELVLDVGAITATYQPGHTHADTFSYELRISGKPYVIDTGISTYDKTPRRQYERSTAAHNTVTIDGKDSAEVWGGFRVGYRYKVTLFNDVPDQIEAELCGFGCGLRHRRRFAIDDSGLEVTDSITPGHLGESYIHLAPDVHVRECTNTRVVTDRAIIRIEDAEEVRLVSARASTEYNRLFDVNVIKMTFRNQMRYRIH